MLILLYFWLINLINLSFSTLRHYDQLLNPDLLHITICLYDMSIIAYMISKKRKTSTYTFSTFLCIIPITSSTCSLCFFIFRSACNCRICSGPGIGLPSGPKGLSFFSSGGFASAMTDRVCMYFFYIPKLISKILYIRKFFN